METTEVLLFCPRCHEQKVRYEERWGSWVCREGDKEKGKICWDSLMRPDQNIHAPRERAPL